MEIINICFALPCQAEDSKHPALVFVLSYFCALLGALVLSHQLGPTPGIERGLSMGLMVGVAYVATSFSINYSFAGLGWKVLAIDAGYHIVQYALFGLVLGAWPW